MSSNNATGYAGLLAAVKALQQDGQTLPVAEKEWYTRPDTVDYAIIDREFETGELQGDDRKQDRRWEGSIDLYSYSKTGGGWVQKIEDTLTAFCDCSWYVNQDAAWERENNIFHWEWIFQIEG